jgi:hypothetical protein
MTPLAPTAALDKGDVFYVLIPSAMGKGKADSGHQGIVEKVNRNTQGIIEVQTIDGGQSPPNPPKKL